jgi:CRISPR-associated protein Cas5t
MLLCRPQTSVVLRTVWRVKKTPLGSPGNTRPDYQQLLTGPSADEPFVALVVWLDSSEEVAAESVLEMRVREALTTPARISRFGGLCLGESTHLVDEVILLEGKNADRLRGRAGQAFLCADRGRLTLPVWVDHVGSAGTRYATGNLEDGPVQPPPVERMPRIAP